MENLTRNIFARCVDIAYKKVEEDSHRSTVLFGEGILLLMGCSKKLYNVLGGYNGYYSRLLLKNNKKSAQTLFYFLELFIHFAPIKKGFKAFSNPFLLVLHNEFVSLCKSLPITHRHYPLYHQFFPLFQLCFLHYLQHLHQNFYQIMPQILVYQFFLSQEAS